MLLNHHSARYGGKPQLYHPPVQGGGYPHIQRPINGSALPRPDRATADMSMRVRHGHILHSLGTK